ncbi:DUF3237 domain-containing protein, partial [Armatimonas sp.]|uniref:DUF3237 domain-containing protein n=1 Tax=Armatimonas sp. TaxID=1872638 RepID=UPI00286C0B28
LTLWYGTSDAPAPVSANGEFLPSPQTLTVGVSPIKPGNRVVVHCRIDSGRTQTIPAVLVRTDYASATQYYQASFPDVGQECLVEYVPVFHCGGRQVPDIATYQQLPSSFQMKSELTTARENELTLRTPTQTRFPFHLDYLFSLTVNLTQNLEVFGDTPEGLKVNWFVEEGIFSGPLIRGVVKKHGGDWMTIRRDGIGDPDIHACLETDDGALIYMTATGVFELGINGFKNFIDNNWPEKPTARLNCRFLTSNRDYIWMNRLFTIAIGVVYKEYFVISYDVYAVR